MKKSVADRWVRSLRYGRRKQTTGKLNKKDSYCCLGVLCELALKDGVCKKTKGEGAFDDNTYYDGAVATLPRSVMEWAGMDSNDGQALINGENTSLTELNDEGKSFTEIARIIEKYRKVL